MKSLSTGTKIALPAAILLLIDLFLDWQDFGNDATEALGLEVALNGWHGFWGILLGLVAILLVAWIGLQIADVDLSGLNMPVTDAMLTLGLGFLLAVTAVIKLLTILGDEPTIWAFVGFVLALVAAYGAYVRSREVEDMPPRESFGGPDPRPADAPAGTTDDDVGMAMDEGATAATGTTLAGGATTSTSGTTATTADVDRDDVEPPPPPTTVPPAGGMPPTTLEPPATGTPDDRPPATTSDDR